MSQEDQITREQSEVDDQDPEDRQKNDDNRFEIVYQVVATLIGIFLGAGTQTLSMISPGGFVAIAVVILIGGVVLKSIRDTPRGALLIEAPVAMIATVVSIQFIEENSAIVAGVLILVYMTVSVIEILLEIQEK